MDKTAGRLAITSARGGAALASVCIAVTCLASTGCGSAASATPTSSGFPGYDWQVLAISHDAKATTIPVRMGVVLQFSPDRQFGASDSVNFHSGTYRTTSDGFTTSTMAVTAVGYAGMTRLSCSR